MVISIPVRVNFYTKKFRPADDNTWFLRYVSLCLFHVYREHVSCNPNIDLIQIIIKPLINIVDVTDSLGNACIVGVHSRLRVTQTIGQVIYVQ